MDRIGISQGRLWDITGLAKPSGTHGDSLKHRSGQPGISSTLTLGATLLGTKPHLRSKSGGFVLAIWPIDMQGCENKLGANKNRKSK